MKAECLLIAIGFPCCNQVCLPDKRAHLMRKKTRYKCQEFGIMTWLKKKPNESIMIRKWNTTWKCLWWQKWRPNGKTFFYYSHVFVISPNQISVPIPFTLMRGRERVVDYEDTFGKDPISKWGAWQTTRTRYFLAILFIVCLYEWTDSVLTWSSGVPLFSASKQSNHIHRASLQWQNGQTGPLGHLLLAHSCRLCLWGAHTWAAGATRFVPVTRVSNLGQWLYKTCGNCNGYVHSSHNQICGGRLYWRI